MGDVRGVAGRIGLVSLFQRRKNLDGPFHPLVSLASKLQDES